MGQSRILIVDDSKVSRMLISANILALQPDALISEAGEATAALAALDATRFDLVILDMNMPGMNGLELARLTLAHANEPRHTVMLSANVQDPVRVKAESLGLKFFGKPVTEAVVSRMLDLLKA